MAKKDKALLLHNFGGKQYEIVLEPHDGLCTADYPVLSFPRGLKINKRSLEIAIHEATHACYPELTEEQVTSGAASTASFIWGLFLSPRHPAYLRKTLKKP